jgi:hypothetical protein
MNFYKFDFYHLKTFEVIRVKFVRKFSTRNRIRWKNSLLTVFKHKSFSERMKNFTHCLNLISLHLKGFSLFCFDHDSRFLPIFISDKEIELIQQTQKPSNAMKANTQKK